MAAKPRDRREYVRLTVNLPTHPKLLAIDDPSAAWLYVSGVCYSGEHLTDGHLPPAVVARIAGVDRKWVQALTDAGLWHAPGHDCPRCPEPRAGQVVVHDYLEHNRSADEAEAAKRSGRDAAAARWSKPSDADRNADRNAEGIPDRNAGSNADRNAEPDATPNAKAKAEAKAEVPSLLTYVSRLAGSDARVGASLPAELIRSWQEIAGPEVDLEEQCRGYLARYADRPAKDERAAWLGWLRAARRHMEANLPARALGCDDCDRGWIEHPDTGIPRRCPTCVPAVAPVAAVVPLRAAP